MARRKVSLNRYLAVMLGGAFGSVVRYAIGMAVFSSYSGRLPVATFGINITGSFLIGLAFNLIPADASPVWRPLIITGVLGGYTTFSSFEWEAYSATRGVASLYIVLSVGLGFLACWSGAAIGRYISR